MTPSNDNEEQPAATFDPGAVPPRPGGYFLWSEVLAPVLRAAERAAGLDRGDGA